MFIICNVSEAGDVSYLTASGDFAITARMFPDLEEAELTMEGLECDGDCWIEEI